MKLNLRTNLLANTPLKIMSCILGYSFWCILSCSHSSTVWIDAPLCFFGDNSQKKISAPEKISVALSAKRTDLHAIDRNALAIHVDTSTLHEGPNNITLDNKSLFLPDSIKLVHYSPANIVIDVKENKV